MKTSVSYFGNRIVRHVAPDMRRLARAGFTSVVHTFCEFDLMFHRGNMRDIVAATHEAGLEVQFNPWGVGKVFGGEPFSNFTAQHFFDGCQVLDDGKPGPFACPNNPLFLDFMRCWLDAAVECGIDALFWDEPHFHNPAFLGGRPGRWGCLCTYCQTLFKEAKGCPMPLEETEDVKAFKAESIRRFLELMTQWGKEAGRSNILYLPAHGNPDAARDHWLPYARLPHVSVFGTGPYWMWFKQPINIVRQFSETVKSLCDEVGREPQIWIQCCKIERGRENEIAEAIKMASEAGIRNLAVWGFEGCAHETWIACEDPEKAWKTTLHALRAANGPSPNP